MKKIEVIEYDPNWPILFEKEKAVIKKCLGKAAIKVEHIGSTSVPGLCAKRDIDILLIVDSLESSLKLQEVGYTFKGEYNVPFRYFFSSNTEERKINLHVCETDHGFAKLQICFRDYLRSHPERTKAYGDLKREILKSKDAGIKQKNWLSNYGRAKDSFIKETLRLAGYNAYTVNTCMHDGEIEGVKTLYKQAGRDPEEIIWSWENEAHNHIILYRGVDIVGCIHINHETGEKEPLLSKKASSVDEKALVTWSRRF